MARLFFCLGSLFALLGVAAGAFGAHVLKGKLSPEMLEVFEVGVRYQMYHALALLATAWVASRLDSPWVMGAGLAFSGGILVFSGTLYLLALSGARWWGAITPLGGVLFLAGWLTLAWTVWRHPLP